MTRDDQEWRALDRAFFRAPPRRLRWARLLGVILAAAASLGGWWGFWLLGRAIWAAVSP